MVQRRPGHHDDLTRLGDAGRQIHPLTAQEIELAEELPRTVASDDSLLAVGTDHDLGCSREDHIEVVGGVPLPIEILAHGHRPSAPERLKNGKLGVIKCGKRDGVVSHGEGWPALRSFPVLCVACVFHGLLHLIVSLLRSFAPRGRHDVRLAAWSAASKASCSQEPRYKTSLMKSVGVPCTPLRSPPSTSSSMRARERWSARARAYCCRSRPTATAKWARSESSRVCWWWKMESCICQNLP